MRNKQGMVVEDVLAGSAAERAGILRGDIVVSINGNHISDEIDYMFYSAQPTLSIEIKRDDKTWIVRLDLKEAEEPGIRPGQFRIKTCRNKCIFCFVDQLPKGLRKPLYIKDEDYRMSFLHGSFITMTNLTDEDKDRIVRQRLSPLYISVHSTNRRLRNRMLGVSDAPDIMKELTFLKKHRIRMHVQIVLCPGVNDGAELQKTIGQLYSLYPYVLSIAVVPVGLTVHRKTKLRPVKKEDAEEAIKIIEGLQRRFRKKHGDPIVYPADELFIKAGRGIPSIKDYGDLPQLENGVGMVSLFASKAKTLKVQQAIEAAPHVLSKKYITFTGVSFYPFLKRFLERLEKKGVSIEAVPIENSFFGSPVTVTGLLTGRDVIKAVSEKLSRHDLLLIPDVVVRDGHDVLIDDISLNNIRETLGIGVRLIESTPEGLIKGLIEKAEA